MLGNSQYFPHILEARASNLQKKEMSARSAPGPHPTRKNQDVRGFPPGMIVGTVTVRITAGSRILESAPLASISRMPLEKPTCLAGRGGAGSRRIRAYTHRYGGIRNSRVAPAPPLPAAFQIDNVKKGTVWITVAVPV